jgi:ATP-dependent DNA helicase RecQ
LFEALRALRRAMAEERGVPPYVIFNDATLHDMIARRPTSRAAFRTVKGVGEWKCEAFGDRFLAVLRNAIGDHEKVPT